MRRAALILAVALLAPGVWAKGKAQKYYLQIAGVKTDADVPAELSDDVKKVAAELLGKDPTFILTLDANAPDPSDKAKFRAYLKKKKLQAFSVTVDVKSFEREIDPPKEGKKGQILKVGLEVSLVGASIPDEGLAISGDGSSTVMIEIGSKARPADDAFALDSALHEAIGHAVDEVGQKLVESTKKKKKH